MKLKSFHITALAIILPFVVVVYSLQYPFFWDTLLTSTVTQYFFEHGFQQGIIPAEWDAGHPPFFYYYITGMYHLFGKSLVTAHAAMLPFAILGAFAFLQLLRHFAFSNQQQFWSIVLFFSVPAVTTQYSLVSYDAVLLSAYLFGLNAYVRKRRWLLMLAALLLVAVSLRGVVLLAALSVTGFFLQRRHFRAWWQMQWHFLPAVLWMAVWYTYHYLQTGWWLSTPAEGWSAHRGLVGGAGWLKNLVSIARAMLDLGALWLSGGALLYIFRKKRLDKMTLLWLVPAVLLSLSFLPFSNPINHRYYLVVLVAMIPALVLWLSHQHKLTSVVVVLLVLCGHIQLYPGTISNGWDCTLAHADYFPLRRQLEDFLSTNTIDKSEIGTVFPMNNSLRQSHMDTDSVRMRNIHGETMDSLPYILYSNIGNDFSDEQVAALQHWPVSWKGEKGMVRLVLYQNPLIINK